MTVVNCPSHRLSHTNCGWSRMRLNKPPRMLQPLKQRARHHCNFRRAPPVPYLFPFRSTPGFLRAAGDRHNADLSNPCMCTAFRPMTGACVRRNRRPSQSRRHNEGNHCRHAVVRHPHLAMKETDRAEIHEGNVLHCGAIFFSAAPYSLSSEMVEQPHTIFCLGHLAQP